MSLEELEKARAAINSLLAEGWDNDAATVRELVAEIERLRAKVGKMEFLMRSDDTCLACAIKLEVIDQQAARIQELEDALVEERVIGEGGFRAEQCEFWYIEDLPEESCMELDGPCDWAKCPRKHELCDVAYQQLAEEGKIGPDAKQHDHTAEFFRPNEPPAKSWQITEERKAAILHCKRMLTFLKEDDAPCYDVEKITKDESVLVAMLKEAGQE